ncbi:3'-5' exonuclease [Streptomonospora sp. S1-112]|uniref:3'-5' exonuclease n=1 Tax=Streptomonospora mangrovi TaxID=2883123 RepID=A0A9X3NND1_9ACTN|nr:exonuclease domain-containing protein [Streptomonospora mangrovi]MDA0565231.1 3'-5' exonuclease [Streptomonospora mangrovi]
MFAYGQLTRQGGSDARRWVYALINLKTTGLHPERGSRICEVAVVRMRGDGEVLDEYATLVDPNIRITNDEFHGITNADVKGAPRFEHIAGDLLAYLGGAIVVGHNLEFFEKFLVAEFGRLGVPFNGVPGLCTLVAARTQFDRYGYRFENVHQLLTGSWPVGEQGALGTARGVGHMLAELVANPPQPLFWRGPSPVRLPELPRQGVIAPRVLGMRKGAEGWLSNLVACLPRTQTPPPPRPEALPEYRSLLEFALSDGKVVGEEAQNLAVLATRAGLTQLTAQYVHEDTLAQARQRAEADGVVTAAELKELRAAAKNLGAVHIIQDLQEAVTAHRPQNRTLKGWRLLPVGEAPGMEQLLDYALANGATVAKNLTKTVRLVVAETDGSDPRLAQARAANLPVMTVDEARKVLEAEAMAATAPGVFSGSQGRDVADRLAAESTPAYPEWHEFWRPRQLTETEYRQRFVDPFRRDQSVGTAPSRPSARPHPSATPRGGSGCAVFLLASTGVGVLLAEVAVRMPT